MTPKEIAAALAAPFPANEVKYKPVTVGQNGKALVAFYLDARNVMDRLDEVVGVFGWRDDYYNSLDKNIVECRLSLIGPNNEWITKSDVGVLSLATASKGKEEELDRSFKGVYSDALKRAAAKWGVGRYLYQIKGVWAPYDAQKKRFVNPPIIPKQFLPGGDGGQASQDNEEIADDEATVGQDADASALTRASLVKAFQDCQMRGQLAIAVAAAKAAADALTEEDLAAVQAAHRKAQQTILANEQMNRANPPGAA